MAHGSEWYRLDNAAKVVPSTMAGTDTRVFRLVCELKEKVDPAILQAALNETLLEFPHMSCYLKRGIFWYYLNATDEVARVTEDSKAPLRNIYMPGRTNLLYRVSYYGRRINVEFYHVLADGTGGYIFLRSLVIHYFCEKYGMDPATMIKDTSSVDEKQSDAFSHFYEKKKSARKSLDILPKKAYQVRGVPDANVQSHLIEGNVSVKEMKTVAKQYGVTIGMLTTSLWVEAILKTMDKNRYKEKIAVNVPVNLRQYFPSETTRNFFGVITVNYDPTHYDGTIESILPDISREFKEQLTEDNIFRTMNSFAELEHNWAVKMIPLFVKNAGVQFVNHVISNGVTTSVSNVGKVDMPKEIAPYIDRFAGFMACRTVFIVIMTYGDNMNFGITSSFTKHRVAMNFFRRLTELGVHVEVATNDYDAEVK
ncbi:MAG: hypothetical protein UHN88_05155 [Eubacterium sp.]|nr:hypothetical protein [Eubacterium sp.]